jgi:hypothetical protein
MRRKAALMSMQFYPAFVGKNSDDYCVRVAGFADVQARGVTVNAAVDRAASALLRKLNGKRAGHRAWPAAPTTLSASTGEVTTLIAIDLSH